jgi:AAA+ ATPase superfamily predicted ATPase
MVTRPGIHQDVKLPDYPFAVSNAIRSIAKQFYITRSFKPVRIGNSEYYAVLARPTDEFSVYINADRELVILFADYSAFEIRTLEAFDEFYNNVDSARIDKSLRFLVSSDSKVEYIISYYLSQTPEYPIIIPTTFNNIQNAGNPLLEATRRNYLLRDLFGYQNALREETFFFGRQDVVNTVLDLAKSGQSSSLFGLRKSGKTSTIYAITRKAKAFGCIATLVDCQNPSVHARDYHRLLVYVLNEVRKASGNGKTITSLGSDLPEISDNFFQNMKSLLGQAKSKILIIFDEIENISPNTAASKHWREGGDSIFFWQILRSFIQSDSTGRLSICLVGTSPHLLETPQINGVANPMYLFSQKRFIPNLTFDETREMIERLGHFMGLSFAPEIIADLQREYGGHPFFIRQVCSTVHQISTSSRPTQVSRAILELAKERFASQMVSYLSDILQQLKDFYPSEMNMLEKFVSGNKAELLEFSLEAPDLVDHLIGYGLIERVGNDIDIKFDAVRHAIELTATDNSLESRWTEILQRRNKLENEIRSSIFHASKSISPSDWQIALEANLSGRRYNELPSIAPAYLLSKKTSPLYLTDLMLLLKDASVLPYISDRRAEIVKAIDAVNKLRKDAHAMWVGDAEFDEVRKAFDLLENEFYEI